MAVTENALSYDSASNRIACRGAWDLARLSKLQTLITQLSLQTSDTLTIDGADIDRMDSAGAFVLDQFKQKLTQHGGTVEFENFSKEHAELLTLVQHKLDAQKPLPDVNQLRWVATVGKNTLIQIDGFLAYMSFIGQLAHESLRILTKSAHFRLSAITSTIFRNGFQALPIIALLSFMIGIVITYQMGLQLRSYGANIFIVDLLGLSILREFGPLLTAIMVAGRTGSAFTAELGMMKLNQEIDALNTMGVTPGELLLLPRILGLIIALPLLTVWADIFGVFGGMVMANNMLGITWYDFLHRFPTAIPLRAFLIGIGKAPVFALVISSIGCFQGMKVEGSAVSVGRNTTRSVVLAIFFIIVVDAIFSVIFSKLKL